MQRLEVSCAVQSTYGSLGAKGLNYTISVATTLVSLLVFVFALFLVIAVFRFHKHFGDPTSLQCTEKH
jgi:membrane protein YdbS with pleckstrin-like domain